MEEQKIRDKKILFLQSFSLTQPGGGAVILQKLIDFAHKYNYKATVAVDVNDVPVSCLQSSLDNGELRLNILNRRLRFGIGRLIGFFTGTALDFISISRIKKFLEIQKPSVVHITAHGITFPLFYKAATLWGKAKVVVSIHDLWTFSVKNYLPNWLANKIFTKILFQVDTCYVISIEMGEYLKQSFGLKQYLVIHDGYLPEENGSSPSKKNKQLNFLYVGLLHNMQLSVINNLMDAMALFGHNQFTIGVCSNTQLQTAHKNIIINNHGWVSSNQLAAISNNYAFGLLPLSFAPKDDLFYRTSLMTKIPFYLKHQLPILCIGPKESASVKLLHREQTGICVYSETVKALQENVLEIINMSEEVYANLFLNGQQSIKQTFNSALIAQKFYKSF